MRRAQSRRIEPRPDAGMVPTSEGQMSLARYADETPRQRWLHREIKWRYRRSRNTFVKIVNLRKAEINMLSDHRYSRFQLPNNDEGRRMMRIMFDHLAQIGEDHCRRWADMHAPWMAENELDDLIDDVGPGKRWSAIALGKALNLTNDDRVRLDIRTIRPIDRTKAQLEQDRKTRDAERKRTRRAEDGATPRAQSLQQTQPWKALGISRATYFRRLRNMPK